MKKEQNIKKILFKKLKSGLLTPKTETSSSKIQKINKNSSKLSFNDIKDPLSVLNKKKNDDGLLMNVAKTLGMATMGIAILGLNSLKSIEDNGIRTLTSINQTLFNDENVYTNQLKELQPIRATNILDGMKQYALDITNNLMGNFNDLSEKVISIYENGKRELPMLLNIATSLIGIPAIINMGIFGVFGDYLTTNINRISEWLYNGVSSVGKWVNNLFNSAIGMINNIGDSLSSAISTSISKLGIRTTPTITTQSENTDTSSFNTSSSGDTHSLGTTTSDVTQATNFNGVHVYSNVSGNGTANYTGYDQIMAKAYSDVGIDKKYWGLLKAQISQESNFDLFAQSKAGAVGLSQFMPSMTHIFSDKIAYKFMQSKGKTGGSVNNTKDLYNAVYSSLYSQAKFMFGILPKEMKNSNFGTNAGGLYKSGTHIGGLFTAYNAGMPLTVKRLRIANNNAQYLTGSPSSPKESREYWSKIYKSAQNKSINANAPIKYKAGGKSYGGIHTKPSKTVKNDVKIPKKHQKQPKNEQNLHIFDENLPVPNNKLFDVNKYKELARNMINSDNLSIYHLALL